MSLMGEHSMRNELRPNAVVAVDWKKIWQCDNLKSHRRCNNMSRMNLSGYVWNVTIFS